jgi:hypothetical protein
MLHALARSLQQPRPHSVQTRIAFPFAASLLRREHFAESAKNVQFCSKRSVPISALYAGSKTLVRRICQSSLGFALLMSNKQISKSCQSREFSRLGGGLADFIAACDEQYNNIAVPTSGRSLPPWDTP